MQFSRKLSLLAAGLACAFAAHAQTVRENSNSQFKPTGKGWGELDNVATAASNGQAGGASRSASTSNLTLHGGPVMTAAKNLYYIWYGSQ